MRCHARTKMFLEETPTNDTKHPEFSVLALWLISSSAQALQRRRDERYAAHCLSCDCTRPIILISAYTKSCQRMFTSCTWIMSNIQHRCLVVFTPRRHDTYRPVSNVILPQPKHKSTLPTVHNVSRFMMLALLLR